MPFPPINIPNFPNWLPKFGDLLRDYRTLRGMTIDELATAVSIAPSALREMEAGKRPAPPKQIVKAIALALQLGGDDRSTFLEAAELNSTTMNALFSASNGETAPATRPAPAAAIFAFLIADIRGYTHFTAQQGDDAAAHLTTRFAEMARAAMERWDGRLVEARGDEVLGVFASARQAVRAAGDLQARYAEAVSGHDELPPGIGIGLDIGEATPVDDGYRGAALNRAARLCSLAGAGETLVSPGVVYVAPHIEGVRFEARGQAQLKGFPEPVAILLAAPTGVIESDDTATDEQSE